jgi:dTDP-4-dehydrorhamnose reductase
MRILLLGKNGQVGWELQRSLQPLGEVIALGRRDGNFCGDLACPDELAATVRSLRPDVIVNAAAYTAVDKAEHEPELAGTINALGPALLAREAEALGACLVHYSTDYVFDGSGDQPRIEDDPTGPLSVYGRTKLEGEQAIRAAGARHLIFRTSWVYAARGGNFAKTILRLAAEREELSVVDDQVGAPTGAELIADVTAHALRQGLASGIYHLAPSGWTSWHGYAEYLLDWARAHGLPIRVAPGALHAVPSSAYPSVARRPLNSRLCTHRVREALALHLPDWRVGVRRMLHEAFAL